MATNTVQGNSVVLSFFKEDWVTYLCATDITVSINSEVLPIRTVGDGHWGKNTYKSLNWSVSISGILKVNAFTDTNFSALDAIDNQLNFNHIRTRCTFYDDAGNIKSLEGYCMVQGINLNTSTGTLVKNDISLIGNGELQFFDGLIPCNSAITGITVTGQTSVDGTVHFTYTYTGAPYQIKYRVDGTGKWVYALVGVTIDYPSLANGSHYVEMIPVCSNGYESDTIYSQSFTVTHALTCSSVITAINGTPTTAYPTYTGTPTQYKYSIDGGAWVYVAISFIVPLGGLITGAHTIQMIPICSNGVEGTGTTKSFTVSSSPALSTVNYTLSSFVAGNSIQIYVNGIMNVSTSSSGSSAITVPTGASVRVVLIGNYNTGSYAALTTQDTTLSTTLDTRNGHCPVTLQYTWTVSGGDTYSINATVTP